MAVILSEKSPKRKVNSSAGLVKSPSLRLYTRKYDSTSVGKKKGLKGTITRLDEVTFHVGANRNVFYVTRESRNNKE